MAPFEPFHQDRHIAVAVSGGADSMALAFLLSRWGRPAALIVDHGLRPGAAAEAARAAERLQAIGVPARVLTLRGLVRKAARTRAARYEALIQACGEAGWLDLAVAHHAQDQAETVLLRQESGTGLAGLAGMAAVTVRGKARILRPLLGAPPDRLRATLRAAGLDWSEDPSNADPATPRARLRSHFRIAPTSAPEALGIAAAAGAARAAVERAVAAELAAVVSIYPEGFAHVGDDALSPPALSALVWALSGRAHPPGTVAVARMSPGLRAGTLHGVVVAPAGRVGRGWILAREPAAVAAPIAAVAGARWDGRFRLAQTMPGATVGALGADAAPLRRRSALPSLVLRSLPAWRDRTGLLAAPHLDFPDLATSDRLMLSFDPARPVAAAAFLTL